MVPPIPQSTTFGDLVRPSHTIVIVTNLNRPVPRSTFILTENNLDNNKIVRGVCYVGDNVWDLSEDVRGVRGELCGRVTLENVQLTDPDTRNIGTQEAKNPHVTLFFHG